MYAAAGGASLASRQARQKQRQNKQKQQKQNKATDLLSKPPQAKQFQNYTDPAVPRLSRVERGTLKPPVQHERRHSTSNYHLKEPHQRARIRESPSISIPVVQSSQLPQPLAQQNHLSLLRSTPSLQSQLPQILMPEGGGKLERRCSFVRQVEEMERCQEQGLLDRCNHICNFEIKEKQWEATATAADFYADYDREAFGSLDYPFSEVICLWWGVVSRREKRSVGRLVFDATNPENSTLAPPFRCRSQAQINIFWTGLGCYEF